MKIRAITTGINITCPIKETRIRKCGRFSAQVKRIFEDRGIEVQTLRITTQPWSEYLGRLTQKRIIDEIMSLEKMIIDSGVDFTSIGTVKESPYTGLIPAIIRKTAKISASVTIGDSKKGIDYSATKEAARAIKRISQKTDRGYGNFRFAAVANCPPDIPFYPASYHKGKACFSIALECSDLVVEAFAGAKNIARAQKNLKSVFERELKRVEEIARNIEKQEKIMFKGIDVSPAPSVKKSASLVYAFEELHLGSFGAPGTLTIAGMITDVLKSLRIKKCGYSGLMLPIMEDYGLAQKCSMGYLDIDKLLTYSSICGTGLDCLPLPGTISAQKIYTILLDIATLSIKLNKPLSARLLPVPHKKAGEMTDFKSPYLVDCKIPHIR